MTYIIMPFALYKDCGWRVSDQGLIPAAVGELMETRGVGVDRDLIILRETVHSALNL